MLMFSSFFWGHCCSYGSRACWSPWGICITAMGTILRQVFFSVIPVCWAILNYFWCCVNYDSKRVQMTSKFEAWAVVKDKVSGSVENPVGRPLRKHMLSLNYSYFGAYLFLCSSVDEKNYFWFTEIPWWHSGESWK